MYTYPHGHSLLLSRPVTNFAKILKSRDQRFLSRSKVRTIITINAFYVTAFLRCRCQRSRFYVPGSETVSLYMQNILNGIDSAGGIEREELVI